MKSLISLILSLVAVTATAEECKDYAKRRMKELTAQGYKLVNEGAQPTAEGLLVFGLFANTDKGLLVLDVMVETQQMVEAAAKEGIKKTGTCTFNGKTLFTATGQQQIEEMRPEPI